MLKDDGIYVRITERYGDFKENGIYPLIRVAHALRFYEDGFVIRGGYRTINGYCEGTGKALSTKAMIGRMIDHMDIESKDYKNGSSFKGKYLSSLNEISFYLTTRDHQKYKTKARWIWTGIVKEDSLILDSKWVVTSHSWWERFWDRFFHGNRYYLF